MAFRIRAFLEFEGRTIRLDEDGLYILAGDFVPPTASLVPNIASGTSANIRGGGDLVTIKAQNRRWRFGVHVRGTSEAEITIAIRKLHEFIRQSSPERPVFFHYRGSNDIPFNPRWGTYGADLRYEIVFGTASATLSYPTGATPNLIQPECIVNLEIKPYAVGLSQLMAYAEGAPLQDDIGTPDGVSRGLKVPNATTNKMTNPIFGDASITWNNAWTNGTNLLEVENTDPLFVMAGKSSAKLLAQLSTLNEFTQSINVGNTNTHILSCYVKKQDSSAVTSADMELTYGGGVTENYDLVGDGWYRVWGVVTGVNAATTTGVIVKQGATIYLDGVQIEERDELMSPLAHGDMLGVDWSSTNHNSTSVRGGCLVITQQDTESNRHPLESAQGSIRLVWKADHPNTEYPSPPVNRFLFLTDTLDHYCAFVPSLDTFQFSDGTNVIVSSAQSWSKGDIIVFHWIWGPGTLKMYFNGVQIATGNAYTPFDATTTPEIKIGSSGLATAHMLGTFMDFSTFDEIMIPAEITADHANILEQIEDDRALAPIPWFWTRAGDGVVENCNDGTKLNYAVADGIPGSVPALTRLRMVVDPTWSAAKDIWLTNFGLNRFIDPDDHVWKDHQGTVESGACGGQTETINISGSSSVGKGILNLNNYDILAGRDSYLLQRLRDAGVNLEIQYEVEIGENISTEIRKPAADTSQRLFFFGPLPWLSYRALGRRFGDPKLDNIADVRYQLGRTTGAAAADLNLDFSMVVVRPFVLIQADALTTTRFTQIEDRIASQWSTTTGSFLVFVPLLGDVIEFEPGKLNILQSMVGRDGELHEVDDEVMTYTEARVTPRWELI